MSTSKRETSEVTVSATKIILDIEGTTTSISFVKDVLFPYVRKHVDDYIKQNLESDSFKTIVDALKSQAKDDEENKVDGVIAIPESAETSDLAKALVDNVLWQMDNDRKTKGLKDLQGVIYEEGYKKGDLKGHVYEDVEPCLKAWNEDGKSIYIYSSGSVQAQKLLYGHSEKGDLLAYIKGHFDTTVGMKGESQSYKKILEEISCSPSEAVFLTDVPKEARAAKDAGVLTLLVSRDGNAPLVEADTSEFQVITSFEDIKFEQSNKKRKLSSENDVTSESDNKKAAPCSEPINNESPEDPIVSKPDEEKMDVDEDSDKKMTAVETSEESKSVEVTSSEEKKEVNVEEVKPVDTEISSSDDSKKLKEVATENSKQTIETKDETLASVDSGDSQQNVTDLEKVEKAAVEPAKAESNEEVSNSVVAEDKVTKSVTVTENIADSTDENEKTDATEKKTEPEESSQSEIKEVSVEKSKESTKEGDAVPEEVSKVEGDETSEKDVVPADKEEVNASDVRGKEDSKSSEDEKSAEKDKPKSEETEEKKEDHKEIVAVNGEAKSNGTSHDDEIPNGKLSNGGASPSAKTNGSQDEAVENGSEESEKSVKAVKKASADTISVPVEPVIES